MYKDLQLVYQQVNPRKINFLGHYIHVHRQNVFSYENKQENKSRKMEYHEENMLEHLYINHENQVHERLQLQPVDERIEVHLLLVNEF